MPVTFGGRRNLPALRSSRGHVHRLAAAANTAALVVVVLLAAVFWQPPDAGRDVGAPDFIANTSPPGNNAVAILVVIDGLRADVARDPHAMPFLCELAARGAFATARVEALIPSTIAGVTTLATGDVPGPALFLRDFYASPTTNGGLFQAVAGQGGRSFVSGPALWKDLYGQWTTAVYAAPALGADDEPVLQAGLAALDEGTYRFGVFHFSRTDEAAHRDGGTSGEYLSRARWCDDALRSIRAHAGPSASIVVTSDHGVTDAGGHAGPEAQVLDTPLVLSGPVFPTGNFGPVRQRDIAPTLGWAMGVFLPAQAPASSRVSGTLLFLLGIAGAIAAATAVWAVSATGADGRPHAFWLNLSLWIAIGLLLAVSPIAAGAVAVAALAIVAWTVRDRLRPNLLVLPLLGLAVGGVWGLTRLVLALIDLTLTSSPKVWTAVLFVFVLLCVDAPRRLPRFRTLIALAGGGLLALLLGGPATAATVFLGFGFGRLRWKRMTRAKAGDPEPDDAFSPKWSAFLTGLSLPFTAALLTTAAGQSLSLSSIDVRLAYHASLGPGGLPAAITLVLLQQALVPLALVFGALPPFARSSPQVAGSLFVGMCVVPVGEALAATTFLLLDNDSQVRALCFACVLRAAAMGVILACGAAVALLVARPVTVPSAVPI